MGLGSLRDVSLADARKARAKWAAVLQDGLDPITERQKAIDDEAKRQDQQDPTFEEMAHIVFEARKAKLRDNRKRGRWFSPLKIHVIPKIGKKRLSTIHQRDIHTAIAPIWNTKHETADKAMNRTRMIFQDARLMGYPVDPFVCDAARHMLGHVEAVETPIPSTPWQEVPDLFARLDKPFPSYLALRWIILTATRGTPARGARFSEIDGDVWIVPADRMKGQRGKVKDFRVPLSSAALDVLDTCREYATSILLFPSPRVGFISQEMLTQSLKQLGEAGRPHGFRSSFRSWVQDTEAASWEVAETALSHTIGNKVERSYARSDLLDRRRILMQKWGDFVTRSAAKVVKLHR
ncbi:site-specific integrase [Aquicoccus sp. SU-CL01552]